MTAQLSATAARIDTAKERITDYAAALAAAQTPTDVMRALADLETVAHAMRDNIAVCAVLHDGWSYAQLGRSLGVSRQAANQTYAERVHAQMHRELRG